MRRTKAVTNESAVPKRRSGNRVEQVLDAAAAQFAVKGFEGSSIRDIVASVDMLPGSLYYHFESKESLLLAVYAEGVRRIDVAVSAAIKPTDAPWEQLEAACVAHLSCLLDRSSYAEVVVRVSPGDVPAITSQLIALRDAYEEKFIALISALELPVRTPQHTLRLMLLGALNWTTVWFQAGRASPKRIVRDYLSLLRNQLEHAD
jgi:TetR/AcrR family transcriptional regulator, cholesterol catabolism regulator